MNAGTQGAGQGLYRAVKWLTEDQMLGDAWKK
jgi:hypothetical protein